MVGQGKWGYCSDECFDRNNSNKPTSSTKRRPTTRSRTKTKPEVPEDIFGDRDMFEHPDTIQKPELGLPPAISPTQEEICTAKNGKKCQFPFKLEDGIVRNACTKVNDTNEKYYCSIKVDENRNHIR